MRSILLCLCLMLMSNFAVAQTKLVETVEKKDGELVIPYKKYILDNGLTLIVHEDHSDPLVHVDVTYHVGSAREELNKSGFAHFFEHMMFQGSENVADEEHFKVVTESGGTLNGTTNRDRTNYFETVPSNQLETMLWLESDRMGFLLNAVTQKKFEIQRSTVKNEKQQNYDNRPYGLYSELEAATLYPYGHPYSWLTIGILEDLDRVDVNDLKNFFLRWYGPNNAVLTIGGDVNTDEVVKMVEKYFGSIPRGPEVEDMKLDMVTVEENRYASYVDKNIRFPALIITYPSVPSFHEDEPALDCLASILGQGKSSYFYKKFVQTRKAVNASMGNGTNELAGELSMFVIPFPGVSLSQFEGEVYEALAEFEQNGVSEVDVEKYIARTEASIINGLSSVRGKVSQLAYWETFADDPNFIQKDLDRYKAITQEDVMRVYNKYIKGKAAVVLSVVPEGMEQMLAKEDNYTPQQDGDNPFPITDYSGLSYNRPEEDFDRAKRPAPGQAPLISVPDFWTTKFDNGIKVIGSKSDEIPTVTITLSIEGGQKLDALNKDKIGLASMTSSMMNEDTENFTAEEMSIELEKLGSSIGIFSGRSSTSLRITSLTKNLDQTLELAEERLLRPKFTEQAFERLKLQAIESAKAALKQPGSIASNVFNKLIYGADNIKSFPVSGIETTITNITLDDVKEFYEKYYSPVHGEMVIVGDIDKDEILGKLDFLKNWDKREYEVPATTDGEEVDKTRIYLVDKMKAPQSQIRIGYLTDLTYDVDGDYFKRNLMNYPLGGAFNSRINLNLREDKGYTYGARSFFSGGKEPGPFTASAGVRGNVSDSAVVEFMKEITGYYEDGITEDELEFMKNSIGQRDALNYETSFQKAGFLNRILTYDLDRDFVKTQMEIMNNTTTEELNKLAKKYLNPDKMNILVVGDKASIKPGLEKLGYEIIELDANGDRINE